MYQIKKFALGEILLFGLRKHSNFSFIASEMVLALLKASALCRYVIHAYVLRVLRQYKEPKRGHSEFSSPLSTEPCLSTNRQSDYISHSQKKQESPGMHTEASCEYCSSPRLRPCDRTMEDGAIFKRFRCHTDLIVPLLHVGASAVLLH